MSDIEHARALLAMAARDLRALKGMLEPETFADEIFGFHAQQAVEKSLKAWIAALGAEYPLTHNIARLLAILEDLGVKVAPLWDLADYTVFAVEFRYGALIEEEEPLNRNEVIYRVQELFEQVEQVIYPH